MSPNVQAFLDTIAWSEGTSTIPGSDDGYDVLVTGTIVTPGARVTTLPGNRHLFIGYADHPAILVQVSPSLRSTAAGRYQQMLRDWAHYKALLRLNDFGPRSQDTLAVQHIRECRALDDAEAGRAGLAIRKCSNIWASFPGNSYGQAQRPVTRLLMQFVNAGGVLA